ncbi:MAG: DivIVA domain-containing protein, partial [Acidimicrobiales bacterium]|nr:DivIVA domain-containing protein [Acidimicrobiales bacterium]
MELTLKRMLEDAEFKKYRGKGYDPAEVDEFLAKAAAMAGKVEVQLTQALEKAQNADGTDVEAEVQRRLQEQLAQNAANAPSEEEVAEEARRTLTMAQRTADAAIKEAREDAAAIVAQAEEKAALLNEEASTASQRAKESAQAD